MKEETDNRIIRIQIIKKTVNHVKTYKWNGKDFHNKSRQVDLHHFCRGGRAHKVIPLSYKHLFRVDMNQKADISVKYWQHTVANCIQSVGVRKGAGFHQKAAISSCFFRNIMMKCGDWEKRGAGFQIKAEISGAGLRLLSRQNLYQVFWCIF